MLTVPQLVNRYPVLYETRRFISTIERELPLIPVHSQLNPRIIILFLDSVFQSVMRYPQNSTERLNPIHTTRTPLALRRMLIKEWSEEYKENLFKNSSSDSFSATFSLQRGEEIP